MPEAVSAQIDHISDFQVRPQIIQCAVGALVEEIEACVDGKVEEKSLHLLFIEDLIHYFSDGIGERRACHRAEDHAAKQRPEKKPVAFCGGEDMLQESP